MLISRTCPKGVSVVDGGGETPGPIPNPEAKPARADGTAPGREWESRLPPTQQLHTQAPAVSTRSQRVLCHIRPLVTHRDHPAGPCIADNHTGTNYGGTPTNSVPGPHSALRTTGAYPTGRAPTVGRKSSTGRRVRPHAPMDSTSTTRPTTHPQQPETGPHSAMRTTKAPPIIGAHP